MSINVFLLIWAFLTLWATARAKFTSNFIGEVKKDEMIFTSVSIPRHAQHVEITFWCKESDIKPIIYLKYNGIPTLDDNDGVVEMLPSPKAIRIYDIQPTQSTLYIGIHGGELLHSYYYFAGAPENVLITVDSAVTMCSSSLQSGANCDVIKEILPIAPVETTTNSQITINTPKYYNINVPSSSEGFSLDLSIPSLPSGICDSLTAAASANHTANNLQLSVDMYLDQPGEDENSGQHKIVFSYLELCTTATPSNDQFPVTSLQATLLTRFPLGGAWTLRVVLQEIDSRLTNGTDTLSSDYSGGMRRRLSQHQQQSSGSLRSRLRVDAIDTLTRAQTSSVITQEEDTDTNSDSDTPLFLSTTTVSLTLKTALNVCPSGFTGYDEFQASSTDTTDSTDSNGNNDQMRNRVTTSNKVSRRSGSEVNEVVHSRREEEDSSRRKKDSVSNCMTSVYPIHSTHTSSSSSGYFILFSTAASAGNGDTPTATGSTDGKNSSNNSRMMRETLLTPSATTSNNAKKNNRVLDAITDNADSTESITNDYVLFTTTSLSQSARQPSTGGLMEIQLRIQIPSVHSDDAWTNMDDNKITGANSTKIDTTNADSVFDITSQHFLVAMRVGGVPFDFRDESYSALNRRRALSTITQTQQRPPVATEQTSKHTTQSTDSDIKILSSHSSPILSFNQYIFSSRDAQVVAPQYLVGDDDGSDDTAYNAPTRRRTAISDNKKISKQTQNNANTRQLSSSGLRIHTSPALTQTNNELIFTWVVEKPTLPSLHGGGGGDDSQIYLRVSSEQDSSTSTTDTDADETNTAPFSSLIMSVKVLFVPCSSGFCGVNGECYSKAGDVVTSVCTCRFPYGGEKCDTLVMSYWFYVIQVSTMVLTNLSMIPGIIFTHTSGLSAVSAALSFAMLASMVYHLCDTDTFCVAGLDFQSLQVLDILFCTTCIAAGILFYAPISHKTHATLIVISAGLLISPIVNEPTNALNIICALVFSLLLCGVFWLLYLVGLNNYTIRGVYDYCTGRSATCSGGAGNVTSMRQLIHPRRRKYQVIQNDSRDEDEEEGGTSNDLAVHSAERESDHEGLFSRGHFNAKNSAEQNNNSNSNSSSTTGGDGIQMQTLNALQNPSNTSGLREMSMERGHVSPRTRDSESAMLSIESQYNRASFRNTYIYLYDFCLDIPHYLYDLRYTFFGICLAVSGLVCFVTQTRTNYWLVHSIWHVCVMSSSYFLFKGRYHFMDMIEYPYETEDVKV